MDVNYILTNKSKYLGLLVDTNLLLLLLIGSFDRTQIGKYGRIQKYTEEDFDKLERLITQFSPKLFLTPNILTEICNLSEKYNTELDYTFFRYIESVLTTYNEKVEKSIDIISKDQTVFYKFGISDASITDLAKQKILVITDDFNLYHYLISQNFHAINYNQLMAY